MLESMSSSTQCHLHFLRNSAYQFILYTLHCTKTILAGTSIAFFLTPKGLYTKLYKIGLRNSLWTITSSLLGRVETVSATVWSIRIFGSLAEIPNFWNQRTALSRLHLAHVQNSTQIAQQRVVSLFCFYFCIIINTHRSSSFTYIHTYISKIKMMINMKFIQCIVKTLLVLYLVVVDNAEARIRVRASFHCVVFASFWTIAVDS